MNAPPPRKRRWRRWLWWSCALLVAARLLLALLLPWLLGLGARAAGLELELRGAHLSLSGLHLRLDDVVLRDPAAGAAPPLLQAHEVFVDASTWQLLHGELVVVDVALAGARVHVVRDADGRLRVPAAWPTAAAEPTPAAQEPAAPLAFEAPLQVVSARLHDLQFVLEDAATSTRTELTLDAEVADLGRKDRPASCTAHVRCPAWFDRLDLQATLDLAGQRATATWQAALRGLRPPSLPWLDDPLAAPGHHVIGIDVEGDLRATVGAAGSLPTLASTLRVRTQVDEQEQFAVELSAGPSLTSADRWDLPIAVRAHGQDLVRAVQLADTHLTATRDGTELRGALRVEGATLRRLQPWLASIGVTLPADGVGLQTNLGVAVHGGAVAAEITDLTIGDGEHRCRLPRLALQDLRADDAGLHIGSIDATGPQLGVVLTADGAVDVFGIRLAPPPVAPPAAPTPPTTAAPFTWPQLALDRLAWQGVDLQFVDRSGDEPATLGLGIELTGEQLALGRDAAPGRLSARLHVPDAVDELRADVEVTPTPHTLAAECQLRGSGITARSMAPWLRRAGITPVLQGGSLRAQLSTQVEAGPAALRVDARLASVRFEDANELLLSLRHVDGQGLTLGTGLDLGSWTADDPYVVVHRLADGALTALGLRFGAAAPTTAAARPSPPGAAPPAAATAAAGSGLRHGPLELRGGALRWIDAGSPDRAFVSLGLDLRVEPEDSAAATAFGAELRVEPGIGTFGMHGSLRRMPGGGQLEIALTGEHLRGEGLRAMLPPQIRCSLEDGLVRAGLRAQWHVGPTLQLTVAADGLSLQDRGTELFALDGLELQLPEVSAERVHLAAARMRGLRAAASATPTGLQLLGLRIQSGAAAAARPAPSEAPPAAAAPGTAVPSLRVDELDLQIERLVWQQRGDTDGEPLVASARLTLLEPWATAADPTATAPCRLLLQAAAPPLCRAARVDATLAPFALAPTFDLSLRADGIDTTALTRVQPGLAGTLSGTCTDAGFTTSIHGRLDLRRRDPLRFDFGSPFGGELMVEATDLRAAAAGPSLLRIDQVAIDVRAVDPRRGDLLLRSIDIEGPQLLAENTAAGLELLGLRLPPPAADRAAGTGPAARGADDTAGEPAEYAVDRLQVRDLALTFTDRTTQPPTVLPLRESDLKVQNLSTRAQTEPRPIAFLATLHGGDVSMERRVLRSSVLAGVLGSAAEALAGARDEHEMELRPLVDEVAISGQVQPFPHPTGRARVVVDRLELPALRGLAKAGGVDIADGVFDLQFDALLQGAAGMKLRALPKFTFLSVSEPPGGPLSTYLKLPAPLDTVLFALRNEDDEQVLPLQLQIPAEGLSGGAVAEAAAEALVRLIADAVASAALRVTGIVTGAVGLGGDRDLGKLSATLEFAAGDPLPAGGSLEPVLAAVAEDPELVVVLHHELGHGDLARAAELANPAPAVVADAVARLGIVRAALDHDRAERAGRTAALYQAGRMQEALAQLRALQAVDERLGALQSAREQALRMQMGDSDVAARRRTRAAAESMAATRLETVRQRIRERLGEDAARRVEWRPPRGVETAGLAEGGRVLATVRRRPPQ